MRAGGDGDDEDATGGPTVTGPTVTGATASSARPKPTPIDLVVGIVNAVLVVAYPIAIWLGLTYLGTRSVSVMVLGLLVPMLAIRLRKADRATFWSIVRVPIAILALVVLGAITEDPRFVLAMPVVINVVLLATFGETLRAGQVPMIERFARLSEPELSAEKQRTAAAGRGAGAPSSWSTRRSRSCSASSRAPSCGPPTRAASPTRSWARCSRSST